MMMLIVMMAMMLVVIGDEDDGGGSLAKIRKEAASGHLIGDQRLDLASSAD